MDWHEVPEGEGGKTGVAVWHEIIEESKADSELPAEDAESKGVQDPGIIFTSRGEKEAEIHEFTQAVRR